MTAIPSLTPTEREIYDREHAALASVAEPERTAMAMHAVELERGTRSGTIQRAARKQASHRQRKPSAPSEALTTAREAAAKALGVKPEHLAENACSFGHGYRQRVATAKRYAATALAYAFGAFPAGEMLGTAPQNVRVMSCELGKHAPNLRDRARALGLELRAAEKQRRVS